MIDIKTVLKKHEEWLKNSSNGKRANLQNANLQWVDLQEANLQKAILQKVNLKNADLFGADLRWADLRWADLREADLQWADLRWADLRGANLRRTNLLWADLRWTKSDNDKIIFFVINKNFCCIWEDQVQISCKIMLFEEWLKDDLYKEIALKYGYSENDIENYLTIIKVFIEMQKEKEFNHG